MEQLSTMACFMMGQANRGKELMVFDWDKAASIIKEKKPEWAQAGLKGDFGNTGGTIYEDGAPVFTSYTYLASTWARPVLILNDDDELEIPCYKMQHECPDWNEKTVWPESALGILKAE